MNRRAFRIVLMAAIFAAGVGGAFAVAAKEALNARGGLGASTTKPAAEKIKPPWANDSGRYLITHYFNWFKTPDFRGGWHNWEWKGNGPKHDPNQILANGRRDIASVYYPTIGPYDSCDPDAIEYHMLSALASRIDGFFIDWYGIPSDEEKSFPPLLDAAQKHGFKMCICFEDKAMFGYHYNAKTREQAVHNAIDNLNYILETHARHPAYFRIDGVPVIVNFSWSEPTRSVEAQGFSANEYRYILSRVREKHRFIFIHDFHGHVKEQYWDVADNLYPWIDVNGEYVDRFYAAAEERRKEGKIDAVCGMVYPGFDNTGVWGWGNGPYVTPREGGAYYRKSWEKALAYPMRFLQLATWNDFGEGATIEPALEYGFQYLEMTEAYAARYKGQVSDGGRWLKLPLRLHQARKAVEMLQKDRPERSAELDALLDRAAVDFSSGRLEEFQSALSEVEVELKLQPQSPEVSR